VQNKLHQKFEIRSHIDVFIMMKFTWLSAKLNKVHRN